MNIAYITDQYWPTISGVCVSIDAFRKALVAQGHSVQIYAPDYPNAHKLDVSAGRSLIHRFRSFRPLARDENRMVRRSEQASFFANLDAQAPDVIHIHTEFSLGRMAILYAKARQIPLVTTAHTNWEDLVHHYLPFFPRLFAYRFVRRHMRKWHNPAQAVIAPTSQMKAMLNTYGIRGPVSIIPTGIDVSDFETDLSQSHHSKEQIFARHPQLQGKRILYFVGRIGQEKNIPFLIDMLNIVRKTHSDTVLLITGDGPAMSKIKGYIHKKGLDDAVVFTGFVAHKKLREYYSLASVFVFASKVESQGLVVLEAMHCGTPVVAIGKMGTIEVMGGDHGGFMVRDDLNEFTTQVCRLLDEPILHAQKVVEAKEHASKWSMETQSHKMKMLYAALMVNGAAALLNDSLNLASQVLS